MSEPAAQLQIVLSESNFACLDGATAKGSPVRSAVDRANQHGRRTDSSGNTVVITCSEAQAEELFRLAQVSCRAAMDAIKTALVGAHQAKDKA
jgi:hypothetical protein